MRRTTLSMAQDTNELGRQASSFKDECGHVRAAVRDDTKLTIRSRHVVRRDGPPLQLLNHHFAHVDLDE